MFLLHQQELNEKQEVQQKAMAQVAEGQRLPKMTTEDDMEAFLESFERVAVMANWDPAGWDSQLGPLLIGPIQVAYRACHGLMHKMMRRSKEKFYIAYMSP